MDQARNGDGSAYPTAWTPQVIWPGSTVAILASGPSLSHYDCSRIRLCSYQRPLKVITVCSAYRLYPWPDLIYACDAKWWRQYSEARKFDCHKVSLQATEFPDVRHLRQSGQRGIDFTPGFIRTGQNSGYQAINLAVHLGAKKIILIGFDYSLPGGMTHFHGDHPKPLSNPSQYQVEQWQDLIRTAAQPLADAGITVLNCSRNSAIDCFPLVPLEEELA